MSPRNRSSPLSSPHYPRLTNAVYVIFYFGFFVLFVRRFIYLNVYTYCSISAVARGVKVLAVYPADRKKVTFLINASDDDDIRRGRQFVENSAILIGRRRISALCSVPRNPVSFIFGTTRS